ncbi:MAG: hypothetical protein CVU18_06590, partial [Betaproteobacteria bacterium HGW-Betaproteobacteria-12]
MSAANDPVLGRRIEVLFRNVRIGQVVSLINASLLAWIAQMQIAGHWVMAWWLLAVGVAGVRL